MPLDDPWCAGKYPNLGFLIQCPAGGCCSTQNSNAFSRNVCNWKYGVQLVIVHVVQRDTGMLHLYALWRNGFLHALALSLGWSMQICCECAQAQYTHYIQADWNRIILVAHCWLNTELWTQWTQARNKKKYFSATRHATPRHSLDFQHKVPALKSTRGTPWIISS